MMLLILVVSSRKRPRGQRKIAFEHWAGWLTLLKPYVANTYLRVYLRGRKNIHKRLWTTCAGGFPKLSRTIGRQ